MAVLTLGRTGQFNSVGHQTYVCLVKAFEWTGALNYTKALPQYQRDLSASNKFTYFFTNQNGGRCYVSGFNEEGLQVTAAGVTDLQTGETIAAGDIGG